MGGKCRALLQKVIKNKNIKNKREVNMGKTIEAKKRRGCPKKSGGSKVANGKS